MSNGRKLSNGGRFSFVTDTLLAREPASVLDVGCHTGWMLGRLVDVVPVLVGVDVNEVALDEARRTYPAVKFLHQSGEQLPFDDAAFEAVILSDVLEHVARDRQQALISEVCRVLTPGGLLVLTAPHAGLTALLDPMDVKRRFPRLYEHYARLMHHTPETAPEIGHQHLSHARLQELFAGRFEVESCEYGGFLEPIITVVLTFGENLRLLPKALVARMIKLRAWESGVPYPRWLAFNAFVVARARERRGPGAAS